MHVKYVKIVSALSTMKRTLSARKVTQYSNGIIRVQRFPRTCILPSSFCDDHLCAKLVESFPQALTQEFDCDSIFDQVSRGAG